LAVKSGKVEENGGALKSEVAESDRYIGGCKGGGIGDVQLDLRRDDMIGSCGDRVMQTYVCREL